MAALCNAAPGRFVMGIGSSSEFIVKHWNSIEFRKPYAYTRDMALARGKPIRRRTSASA